MTLEELYGTDILSDADPEYLEDGDQVAGVGGLLRFAGKASRPITGQTMNKLKGEKLIRMLTEEGQSIDRGLPPIIKEIDVVPEEEFAKYGVPGYDMISDGLHRLTTARAAGYKTPARIREFTEDDLRVLDSRKRDGSLQIPNVRDHYLIGDQYATEGTDVLLDEVLAREHAVADMLANNDLRGLLRLLSRGGIDLHETKYVDPWQYINNENSPLILPAKRLLEAGVTDNRAIHEAAKNSKDPVARYLTKRIAEGHIEAPSVEAMAKGRLPYDLQDMDAGRREWENIWSPYQ